jgi:hypothetical protein
MASTISRLNFIEKMNTLVTFSIFPEHIEFIYVALQYEKKYDVKHESRHN